MLLFTREGGSKIEKFTEKIPAKTTNQNRDYTTPICCFLYLNTGSKRIQGLFIIGKGNGPCQNRLKTE